MSKFLHHRNKQSKWPVFVSPCMGKVRAAQEETVSIGDVSAEHRRPHVAVASDACIIALR